jgi:excisionase family DNA binding protein
VYNLATAAAAAGVNKSTVLRHIRAGKISATRDEGGGWQIDPAEFHRTFPPLKIATATPAESQRYATTDQLVAELRAGAGVYREGGRWAAYVLDGGLVRLGDYPTVRAAAIARTKYWKVRERKPHSRSG